VHEAHENICGLVLAFLNKNIRDESATQDTFAQLASNMPSTEMKSYTAEELPPTPNQFFRIVESRGVDKALEIFRKFHELEPERVFFQERQLNLLGYQALNRGQIEDAIKLFQMNTVAYPHSCNTWDSLSDGYMAADDTENAIECMKKVLETIPIDTVNDDQLKAQLKEKCERMLNELQG
jgi:tetratricopeptide (TPR) repeat protein